MVQPWGIMESAPIQEIHPPMMRDYRCPNCGRLLFRAYLVDGAEVRIRCGKCAKLQSIKRVDGMPIIQELAACAS